MLTPKGKPMPVLKRFSIRAIKPYAEPSKLLDHEMKIT